eukprot:scaffold1402_cov254-Pinguiococcus_pyrenoidosus.AAC.21
MQEDRVIIAFVEGPAMPLRQAVVRVHQLGEGRGAVHENKAEDLRRQHLDQLLQHGAGSLLLFASRPDRRAGEVPDQRNDAVLKLLHERPGGREGRVLDLIRCVVALRVFPALQVEQEAAPDDARVGMIVEAVIAHAQDRFVDLPLDGRDDVRQAIPHRPRALEGAEGFLLDQRHALDGVGRGTAEVPGLQLLVDGRLQRRQLLQLRNVDQHARQLLSPLPQPQNTKGLGLELLHCRVDLVPCIANLHVRSAQLAINVCHLLHSVDKRLAVIPHPLPQLAHDVILGDVLLAELSLHVALVVGTLLSRGQLPEHAFHGIKVLLKVCLRQRGDDVLLRARAVHVKLQRQLLSIGVHARRDGPPDETIGERVAACAADDRGGVARPTSCAIAATASRAALLFLLAKDSLLASSHPGFDSLVDLPLLLLLQALFLGHRHRRQCGIARILSSCTLLTAGPFLVSGLRLVVLKGACGGRHLFEVGQILLRRQLWVSLEAHRVSETLGSSAAAALGLGRLLAEGLEAGVEGREAVVHFLRRHGRPADGLDLAQAAADALLHGRHGRQAQTAASVRGRSGALLFVWILRSGRGRRRALRQEARLAARQV